MFPTLLIVDDEVSILKSLGGLLMDEGFEVLTALNGYEALKILDQESPDLVLLDIWMPGIDGIETLIEIKKNNPFLPVIIITGHGNIETAVKATKLGAFDLIEKPLSIDKVIVAINNALNFRQLEEENRYLRKKNIEKHSIDGNSPAVLNLKKQIQIIAATDSWVLIKGENGTGKELVARTIHHFSDRAENPLIDVNCAAIQEELIESELFGHEKGSFQGAVSKKTGKFELAGQGTLFFDEIGDMALKTQAKILRVLQERQFQRVGGSRVIHSNVRVIAATNKDLEQEIKNGNFREDLFYRLNVVPLEVPPLRERSQDIPLLVEKFLAEFAKKNGRGKQTMKEKAARLLTKYSWPGNVRELKNIIERLSIMVSAEIITVDDIPAPYNPKIRQKRNSVPCFNMDHLKEAQAAFELEFIQHKISRYDNDINKTAKIIGVKPAYIKAKLK